MSLSAREGGAAAAVAVAARAVMADVDVCGEIITRGLVEADTRHHAAKCLDAVAAGEARESLSAREGSAAAAAAAALLPWLPWLECDLDDDVVGRATSAAAAAAVRAAPADGPRSSLCSAVCFTRRRDVAPPLRGVSARARRAPAPDDSTRGDSPRERPRQDRSVRGDPSTRRSRLRGGGVRRGVHRARTRDETEHDVERVWIARRRRTPSTCSPGTRSDRVFDARRRINCASARETRGSKATWRRRRRSRRRRCAAAALARLPCRWPRLVMGAAAAQIFSSRHRALARARRSTPNSPPSPRATARRVPSRSGGRTVAPRGSFRLCFTRDRRIAICGPKSSTAEGADGGARARGVTAGSRARGEGARLPTYPSRGFVSPCRWRRFPRWRARRRTSTTRRFAPCSRRDSRRNASAARRAWRRSSD